MEGKTYRAPEEEHPDRGQPVRQAGKTQCPKRVPHVASLIETRPIAPDPQGEVAQVVKDQEERHGHSGRSPYHSKQKGP